MFVRWGLEQLPDVLEAMGVSRPLLVTYDMGFVVDLPIERRFEGALPHADVAGVEQVVRMAGDSDCLIALGGGSAIDTAKFAAVQLNIPICSIPTTYSGAEWTPFFGNRDARTGKKSAGTGARMEGIVYEPKLTLNFPAFPTCGTAMNALTHAAESLYTLKHTPESDIEALTGAELITRWLPKVMANGQDLEARTGLLEGAMHAGAGLRVGMAFAHAIAQILGGKYDLPHGALNAVVLPPTLRWNADVAGDAIAKLGEAMGTDDPATRCYELGLLGVPMRLREYKVPHEDFPVLSELIADRPASKSNPKPVTPAAVLEVLEACW